MDRGLQFSLVIVSLLVVGTFGFSFVASDDAAAGVAPPPVPKSTGSSPKFHVVEIFTGTWCPPCANADPALSRLTDEYRDDSVFLFWHCCTDNVASGYFDPYWTASTYDTRRNFYVPGNFGIPTVIFDGGGEYVDGTLVDVGSGTSSQSYDTYRFDMEDNLDSSSNILVTVDADMSPAQISVTTSIYASELVTQTNLYVRTIVYEDAIYYMGTNLAPYHRNIALAMNQQQLLTVPNVGETVIVSTTFTIPPGGAWNLNKLGVAALVQSDTRRTVTSSGYSFTISDVLNADKHDLVPRGILLHMDQGTAANYAETYEKILSLAGEHFDTSNVHALGVDTGVVDDRGLPGGTKLADASALVWNTGLSGASVLDVNDRTVIGSYLDGGGSLLITGSDIGFDAWGNYRSWYQQYLHAIYEGDDTGYTTVTGVAGDPISDNWAATSLGVLGDPDRINAVASPNNAVPFAYTPTTPASVRAQHDSDSRVVYLGFRYFENTIDANRVAVMGKIIDWLDGASAPSVAIVYPDGGEQIAQGAGVGIRWRATDVRSPADAVDVYFNDNYPSGAWQLLASGEPNDGLYRWTLPNIDSAACRVRIVVRDSSPTSPDGEAVSSSDFICGDPGFTMSFTSADLGWHLISHPLILGDTSVQTVLNSIAGSYGAVRFYDPTDTNDPWKAYVPGKTLNDLEYVDNTMGFWIQITAPCTLQILGSKPTSPTMIPLRAGWNLVGFPSSSGTYTVSQLMADTGATRVEGFDSTASPYYLKVMSGTDPLQAGRGYWVYAQSATIWSVPV